MNDFSLKVDRNGVSLEIADSVPDTNLKELLEFDSERLAEYYPQHAALQAYWEELANKLRERYEQFKQVDYRKWWSHNRRYAKLVLAAFGDKKPTNDAIQDMVILIYTQELTEQQREKYLELAYKESNRLKGVFSLEKEDFRKDMYYFVNCEYPVFFEEIEKALISLERSYESVRIVAERLNSRSFHMQEVAKLVRQKPSNTNTDYIGNDREVVYREIRR